jgi:hypothetical protein
VALALFCAATLTTVIVGIAASEIHLFTGSLDGAMATLQVLAAFQGGMGVLLISAGAVVAQLASPLASVRGALHLLRNWAFWLVVGLVFTSAVFDISILARLGTDPIPAIHARAVDLALVSAICALLSALAFLLNVGRLMSPDAFVAKVVESLDERWIERALANSENYQHTMAPRYDDEPMLIVERVLASALERRDTIAYVQLIGRLHGRLTTLVKPNSVIGIDAYLDGYLRDVVQLAAETRNESALLMMLELMRDLGAPDPPKPAVLFGPPGGELLVRRIVDASLRQGLTESAAHGLIVVSERCRALLGKLPPGKGTYYDPNYDFSTDDKGKEDRFHNQSLIGGVYEMYLTYFSSTGASSLRAGAEHVTAQAALAISMAMLTIVQTVHDAILRPLLFTWALWSAAELVRHGVQERRAEGLSLLSLDMVARAIEEKKDVDLAGHLAETASMWLRELAKGGMLTWGDAMHYGLAALHIGALSTEAQLRLMDAMVDAALAVRPDDGVSVFSEQRHTYRELVQRLRQQISNGGREGAGRIRDKLKEAMERLEEPLFEERQ